MKTCHIFMGAILLWVAGPCRADDWPQWMGPRRDGVWRESGITNQLGGAPKYLWRASIGAGYAGPAVANGKVFVADRVLAAGAKVPSNSFARTEVPGQERLLCLNESDGSIVWTHAYDCPYRLSYANGPRCTPVVADGKVYSLGAMGDLFCLDAATGKVVWRHNLVKDYKAPVQIWGFAAHPLLDGNRLICLVGGEHGVVAFDKNTGKEIWTALEVTNVGYCPPVIYEFEGQRQLIIWHPQSVNGLNPVTGQLLWTQPFVLHQSALSIPMPIQDGENLFVTSFYNGPMMLRVAKSPPGVELLWKGKSNSERAARTDKLHSIMPTPIIRDGHIYGICSYGQLRCLRADTGERVWETMRATRELKDGKISPAGESPTDNDRWGNAFLTPQADRYWLFNEHGDLILAKLSKKGYEELGRCNIVRPDNKMAMHPVVWSHPAYANKSVFARNDSEIVRVDLSQR